MMTFMKKYILPVVMVILVVIVWNAAGFLKESSDILPKIMASNLPFRVNPEVFGGDIIASINDEVGDNKTLKLPENDVFKNGYKNTDIITYTVHKPARDGYGKWSWNIDLEFVDLGKNNKDKFDLIKGVIYIDINDGKNDGNNKAFSDGEKISFSDDFRWNYMVSFDYLHEEGILYSNKSKQQYPVIISYLPKIATIRLTIPLVEKFNKDMTKEYMGSHIAVVGFYSPYDDGELVGVAENADRSHSGGGNNYENLTPYYDFVASKIDNPTNDYVMLAPVKISEVKTANGTDILKNVKTRLLELSRKEYESHYGKISNDEINNAKKLSDEGEFGEAESIFSKYLDESSIANTYYGTIEARKAGMDNISVSQKVNLVNSSFRFFGKAENLVKDDNDLYILLNNRIGVASSVPDNIFGKLVAAETDLKKFLTFDLTIGEKAESYLKLIDIYEKKNKTRELKLLLNEIVTNEVVK